MASSSSASSSGICGRLFAVRRAQVPGRRRWIDTYAQRSDLRLHRTQDGYPRLRNRRAELRRGRRQPDLRAEQGPRSHVHVHEHRAHRHRHSGHRTCGSLVSGCPGLRPGATLDACRDGEEGAGRECRCADLARRRASHAADPKSHCGRRSRHDLRGGPDRRPHGRCGDGDRTARRTTRTTTR